MNTRYKYPRTPHLPWSPGATKDDVRCVSTHVFEGRNIVVTEKMDGENTTLYTDYYHARSIDSRNHPSRNWVKRMHTEIAHEIPLGWRVCGENLYAQHSIVYDNLKSYFYGFSIWNELNMCLSWAETMEWFGLLNLESPPILYRGLWDDVLIRELKLDVERVEGFVVRIDEAFHFNQFKCSVAKWVRSDHVDTENHWMHTEVVANGLASSNDSKFMIMDNTRPS